MRAKSFGHIGLGELLTMQKFNTTHSSSTASRDTEQQRLADNGAAGDGLKGNGKKHMIAEPVENAFCTKRKMLVGLDIICLLVGM